MNKLQDLKKKIASVYPNVSSMKTPHGYEGNFEIGCQWNSPPCTTANYCNLYRQLISNTNFIKVFISRYVTAHSFIDKCQCLQLLLETLYDNLKI